MVFISDTVPGGVGSEDEEPWLEAMCYEGTVFEDVTDAVEPTERIRFAIPADADEVLVKFRATYFVLYVRCNLVFHFPSGTILNPGVLDDAHLPCRLVYHLKHPCPLTGWCISTNVVEWPQGVILRPLDSKLKVEVSLADSLDFRVEAEVCLGGGGKQNEEIEE